MEGVLALLIPIVGTVGFFGWLIARSPVGRAYADRLRGTAVTADRADLEASIEALRAEVAELAERIDFTERLVAKEREAPRLAPPS
jgi:hypothetical protein